MSQFPALAFAHNSLDRCANHRSDETWLAERWEHVSSRHVQVVGDKTVVMEGKLQTTSRFDNASSVLLGLDADGVAWFASRSGVQENLMDLRSLALAGNLSPQELGILAQARSLLHWHERHSFCSNCGAKTEMRDAGYRRHCAACEADHFPRTDPVIIIAVCRGDKLLLGRQKSWAPGMYSTLAGFMEPGETIEDAARREVFEEAGIRLGIVSFHSNQPWPFPSSLMIGLVGEALNDEIVVDVNELETACWFDKQDVLSMLDGSHANGLHAPPPMAIAHHLIRAAIQL